MAKKKKERCKHPMCDKPAYANGYCRGHYRSNLRNERMDMLVAMFGNKCAVCQGSFPPVVYDFHHRDPSKKSFNIGRELAHKSWEAIMEEAEKCILICSNCHRLAHHVQSKCFD